ncbi:hypothetical protein [Deinococcus cellulosilyticus]|uniref:Uncharacterized protein n=1 Tax=Deinococcus cellulosilyticus (strain DSM 18568 / NBRC 106333 / KACC 11606 / 5516J-15) TaxID=1223518 RepID=A0A511NB56_DEIC1|nr:hypothetical protein [Deinococcus cellulosilyticus]GEM50032.1 hypothetical protein DC3_56670 [Deinococcus cellulosilyticus NBRC 106333 = KACC 11606]
MRTFELSEPYARVNGLPLTSLQVSSSLVVPWRSATIRSDALQGQVSCIAGYRGKGEWPVFQGLVDSPESDVLGTGHAVARGLHEWRKVLPAQSFQDPDLQTVLQFVAAQCSGKLSSAVKGGRRRHYSYRPAPAYQIVAKALQDWAIDHVLLELDGGTLYAGPEQTSPHAQVGVQAELVHGQNIIHLKRTSAGGFTVRTLGMPWLRIGHRIQIQHPLLTGSARICEQHMEFSDRNTTSELRVMPL